MFWALLNAKISSQNALDTDTIFYYKFMFVSFPFLSDQIAQKCINYRKKTSPNMVNENFTPGLYVFS